MKKIFIILGCLLLLTGCGINSEDNSYSKSNKEKLITEIEYVSKQIAKIFHNLNNISLQNYELVSKKVSISEEASSSESSQSSGGSEQSSGQDSSSGQSSSGSEQSSNGNKDKSIVVTEMQNSSVLKKNTEDIDWDRIMKDIENINTAWSIVMLDLSKENVPNDEIMAFSSTLNSSIISIKNNDKENTLINLTNLYSYIPIFLTSISADKHIQDIENTKFYVFTSYSAASQENWNEVSENLTNAGMNFLSLKNNQEYYMKNEFKINKIEMLINDIKYATINSDKELFFLKYKNLIESLNTL